jgi:hypothetical protein
VNILDYIANGSEVAKLQLDMSQVRIQQGGFGKQWQDVAKAQDALDTRVETIRTKVFEYAERMAF